MVATSKPPKLWGSQYDVEIKLLLVLHRLAVCLTCCCRACAVHRMRDGCIQTRLTCRLRQHASQRGRPPSRSGAGCWSAACLRETRASILQQHGVRLASGRGPPEPLLLLPGTLVQAPAGPELHRQQITACQILGEQELRRAPAAFSMGLCWSSSTVQVHEGKAGQILQRGNPG